MCSITITYICNSRSRFVLLTYCTYCLCTAAGPPVGTHLRDPQTTESSPPLTPASWPHSKRPRPSCGHLIITDSSPSLITDATSTTRRVTAPPSYSQKIVAVVPRLSAVARPQCVMPSPPGSEKLHLSSKRLVWKVNAF